MPTPSEGRELRILGGYLLFAGILALILTPLYLYAAPFDRPLVVRLGAGVVLGVALIHLTRIVRGWIAAQPASAFERALDRPPVEARLAPQFLKLRDELRFSITSQQYYEGVLEPRLERLLAGRSQSARELPLAEPRKRRWLRRGPSRATLQDLITRIEELP
jgi:hypothetical protein